MSTEELIYPKQLVPAAQLNLGGECHQLDTEINHPHRSFGCRMSG
jgi:hypothetical protein